MNKRIAILGGGISGLSAAFHLSRRFPEACIRLFEKSDRLGGWIRSERVQVQNGRGESAEMLLEAGPRTLRPNAGSVLELIHLLNLRQSVIAVPKTAAAARNRFIYVPELGRLEALPTALLAALKSPLRSLLVPAVGKEFFKKGNRPAGIEDESVHSLLSRRFGERLADTLGSAMIHGIYAADSRNVSVRAAFPFAWPIEDAGDGSLVWGMSRYSPPMSEAEYDVDNLVELMSDLSVFSFKGGLGSLTDSMRDYLLACPEVNIETNSSVLSIEGTKLQLAGSEKEFDATHIVSTIPLPAFQKLLPTTQSVPHLIANPASSVTVINFVFPVAPSAIHPAGFGYLIPRPPSYDGAGPGILGVTFDSCSLAMQDTPGALNSFTKLTVMLGGPYHRVADVDEVLKHLAQHLGLKELPVPVLTRVHKHEQCISTPTPGHLERMVEMRKAVKAIWDGRLEVIGGSVDGVSVGDCVEAGKNVGQSW